jgi:hypothetical protein
VTPINLENWCSAGLDVDPAVWRPSALFAPFPQHRFRHEIARKSAARSHFFQTSPNTFSRYSRSIRPVGNFTDDHYQEIGMSRTPNDDRSDSMNPNNDKYDDSQDNRSDQLNPNNDRYQGPDKDGNDD